VPTYYTAVRLKLHHPDLSADLGLFELKAQPTLAPSNGATKRLQKDIE